MKAISLWQPWATLMATAVKGGAIKTVETRGWPTRHRGALAIHAAKRQMDRETRGLYRSWVAEGKVQDLEPMPYGAIVALV